MIKPLREAYENYERMRLEEEAVEAAAAGSSPDESATAHAPKKILESSRNSPKKMMGVSKEIRDIFHEKSKESKQADKDQGTLARGTMTAQVKINAKFANCEGNYINNHICKYVKKS